MNSSGEYVLKGLVFALICGLLVSCRTAELAVESSEAGQRFPPAGVDHLAMKVHVDVEIFGLGHDENLLLEGDIAVSRSGATGDGSLMRGDMVGATLRGRSSMFGEVIAVQSPIQHSPCEYVWEGPGRYRGHFDINAWFWLPEHDLTIFSVAPVRVEGIAAAIPPVGQKATIVSEDITLLSFAKPKGNAIGVLHSASGEVGAVLNVLEHLQLPDDSVPALLEGTN